MLRTVIAAAFVAFSGVAQAATILEYETAPSTTNPTLAPNAVGAGVTGIPFEAGNGIVARPGGTWNWRDWTRPGGGVNDTAAEAFFTGDSWTWGFTSTQAYDLSSFDIRLDRSSTGPNMFAIIMSVNDMAPVTVLTDDFNDVSTGRTYFNVDVSAYGAGATKAIFSLAAFGEDSGGATSLGTFDLEKIASKNYAFQLRGALAPVPLPASALLLIAGLGGLGLMRTRA